jgi:tetratricopeptide (TPR) repeat protein
MAWLKESAYQKQIIIYLNNRAFGQAYDFSREYLTAYPNDMAAHFLAAKSSLKAGKLEEAALEARKAFNLAKAESDMLMCAIHGAVAYFRLGDYRKGYELLKATDGSAPCQEVEQLAFLFCLALDMDCEGATHFKNMFAIDKDCAGKFVTAVAEGVPIDYDKILKKADKFDRVDLVILISIGFLSFLGRCILGP